MCVFSWKYLFIYFGEGCILATDLKLWSTGCSVCSPFMRQTIRVRGHSRIDRKQSKADSKVCAQCWASSRQDTPSTTWPPFKRLLKVWIRQWISHGVCHSPHDIIISRNVLTDIPRGCYTNLLGVPYVFVCMGVSLYCSPLYVLRHSLSMNLELFNLARLAIL